MRIPNAVALALVLGLAAVPPASAHAPGELEKELRDRETYFQPMD